MSYVKAEGTDDDGAMPNIHCKKLLKDCYCMVELNERYRSRHVAKLKDRHQMGCLADSLRMYYACLLDNKATLTAQAIKRNEAANISTEIVV